VPKGPGANPALAALAGNDNVSFKPQVKHVVSKELILFFDKIRAALMDEDADPEVIILRGSALESVRSDPGLQQLVPYFTQFVAEKVTHSLNNTFVLRQMMELTAAMIANKSLFIDPYVAALVPPILTCLIGRNLGPGGVDNLKDQYQLRDLAASLIGQISNKYAQSSAQVRTKLARTCLKNFLDPSRSLGEHYGAILGLSSIGGPEAIKSLVLPSLKHYEYVITKAQNERGPDDEGVRMIIAGVTKAVMSLTESTGLSPPSIERGFGIFDQYMVFRETDSGSASPEEGVAVEEYLGSIIGSRIATLGNSKLNMAILAVKEKHS
jgi:transcription initiation factor TFIID subunit 6